MTSGNTERERERVRYTKAIYRYCRYICTICITICFADYVGFIKKIMKLLQHGYGEVQSIEIELRILEETSAPPSRPRKLYQTLSKHFFPSLFLSLSIYLYIYISLSTIQCIWACIGCVRVREGTARDGYIIYCYGDCNRKFEEALRAQQKTGDGDNLMKAIWLDMYTDQLSARRK